MREIDSQVSEINKASCDKLEDIVDNQEIVNNEILQNFSKEAKGPGSLEALRKQVEDAVTNGEISQEEANEILKEAEERIRIPFDESQVTSGWGIRNQEFHEVVDFKAGKETEVYATAPGKVARSWNSKSYGETVILDHGTDADGNRYYTAYAHNNRRLVEKEGDSVAKGDHIANSGNTGSRSKGPHVHYEVIVVPKGGPDPYQKEFFTTNYSVDPLDHMWSDLKQ